MKLIICTKFRVNRMNCVESRRGGGGGRAGAVDPPAPSSVRVTIFSPRLLGLKEATHFVHKSRLMPVL